MAVPKRKLSKRRKRLRRGTHPGAGLPTPAWPRGGSAGVPPRVCGAGGYDAGNKRLEVEDS